MKLDTVIPNEAPAIVAESQQRRLGKYQVLGTWSQKIALSAADFTTTGPRALLDPDLWASTVAEHGNWGEQDDGKGIPRSKMPTSIRLAIDPTLAPEGDE